MITTRRSLPCATEKACYRGGFSRNLLSVKGVPGTLQSGGASFATTRWSVLAASAASGAGDSSEAEAAVAQLCRDYWPPLYSFVRRRGYSSANAQDLVQGFFTYFLRTKIYAQARSERGKFRSFLLASLNRYLIDDWHRENRLKRGGGESFVVLDEEIERGGTTPPG